MGMVVWVLMMMMLYFYSEANDLTMKFNSLRVERRLLLV